MRKTEEAFIVLQEGYILCYQGLADRRERGVGFLIDKNLADDVEEFFRISERVAGLIIRLNKRYRIRILQIYAPASPYSDEEIENFCEEA